MGLREEQTTVKATPTADHRDGATAPVDSNAAMSKAINVFAMTCRLAQCERTGTSLTDGNIQAGE